MTATLTPLAPQAPPLSPQRKVILVLGGLLSLVVITLATLCIVDYMARTSYERDLEFAASGAKQLTVRTSHEVSVTASQDGKVHVHKSVSYGLARPDFIERSAADGVTLEADCHGWLATSSCSVAYQVQVPREFRVTVVSSTGALSATGLDGNVQLTTAAGDIQVSRMGGDLTLRTRAGNVVGTDLGESAPDGGNLSGKDPTGGATGGSDLRGPTVEARASAGDVTLAFTTAPRRVTARTSAGNVDVAVPPGSSYRIEPHSRAGNLHVAPSLESPGSSWTIVVSSSAGDVTVHRAE
jgi:hypothetical protein